MIAARQIAFGRGSTKRKPYDAEIEYLESTGTQYIDLGFLQDKQYRAEMDVSIPVSSAIGNCVICGANQTTSIGSYLSTYTGSTKFLQMYITGSNGARIPVNDNRTKIIIDTAAGMLSGYGSTVELGEINVSPSENYMIFASRRATNSWAGTRFYSFKYESDLHSVDFIPVRKGNVGYMYDSVSGQLFGNQGTGEFVLGPDIIDYTAKDYIQDGLVAMWDGIENAGWGTHVDTLPVKYGMPNLSNLVSPTISVDGVDYDFGLNVSGMTVERDGLSWSDTSAWAGWGYAFNTSQISSQKEAMYGIAGAFPTNADTGQELTLEIVARLDTEGEPSKTVLVAGYNERSIYANYSGLSNNRALVRWFRDGATKYEYFQSPFASGRAQTISLVQSPDGVNVIYVDGSPALVKTGQSGYFLYNMVAFLRDNQVQHPWSPSGKFYCLRASNRALTAEEIAYNYNIDKQRFGL